MPFDPLKAGAELANNAAGAAKDLANQAGAAAQVAGATIQSAARDFTDKAAQAASQGAQAIQDTASKAQRDIDIRRYNPLFLEDYREPDYTRPKLIVLADPSPRKDIEVCKGSIGWTSKEGTLDVLHLYDSSALESNLTFYPSPIPFGVYYADPLEPDRYIYLSKFFDVVQQDQMTELHDIAYALGAKHCRLEIIEEEKIAQVVNVKGKGKILLQNNPLAALINAPGAKLNGNCDNNARNENNELRSVKFDETFSGNAEPRQPDLHWYANDKTIKSLINKRLGDGNELTNYSHTFEYKTSNYISEGLAGAIDVALKQMKADATFNFEGEYKKETRTKMELLIEF